MWFNLRQYAGFTFIVMLFYVASVVVNVLVASTHRNVYFIAWTTVSALRVLSVLFLTLLVATVL